MSQQERAPFLDREGMTRRPSALHPLVITTRERRDAMLIRRLRGWELPEGKATAETLLPGRRKLMAGAAGLALASALHPETGRADSAVAKSAAGRFDPQRPLTPERDAETYNNYYEFGTDKDIWEDAKALPLRPWAVVVDGMVGKPQTFAIDDLLARMPIEERIYRHRCVEAWAMTVPWSGFPLSALLAAVEPQAGAKYVRFETLSAPKFMPGLQEPWYPWPYIEALTLDEAGNELTFLATGLYGKPMPPQNGGPIRLVVPWKYGFKSAKALVRISLVDKRPATFWQTIQPREYGFWANVNPNVAHPRWSQASERLIGTNERVPTQIYNGYGAFVASLYAERMKEPLFM
jgi:sulfoxide reductase catalytic subunit YedY